MHAYIYIYVYCKIYLIYIYIATHCIIIHTVIFLQTLLMNCLFGVYSVALTHNRRGVGESPVSSRSQEQLFDSQRALSDARRALSATKKAWQEFVVKQLMVKSVKSESGFVKH